MNAQVHHLQVLDKVLRALWCHGSPAPGLEVLFTVVTQWRIQMSHIKPGPSFHPNRWESWESLHISQSADFPYPLITWIVWTKCRLPSLSLKNVTANMVTPPVKRTSRRCAPGWIGDMRNATAFQMVSGWWWIYSSTQTPTTIKGHRAPSVRGRKAITCDTLWSCHTQSATLYKKALDAKAHSSE